MLDAILQNISRVIRGKDEQIRLALVPLLARGHLLLNDVPGVGKTMLARAIARSVDASFSRVQFTPDLMPMDVTGSAVWRPSTEAFEFRRGPVFTDILLADEINRATPRTQSALLECMAERQVTSDSATYPLPAGFTVIATLNPVEQLGTYPLPEAQLDRFLLQLRVGYPAEEAEIEILSAQQNKIEHPIDGLQPVASLDEVTAAQRAVTEVRVAPNMQRYLVQLAEAMRDPALFRLGCSPRGTLALMRAAQAWAYLHGESFVAPQDVQVVATYVLGHRVQLQPQVTIGGTRIEDAIAEVIARVPVPTSLAAGDASEGAAE